MRLSPASLSALLALFAFARPLAAYTLHETAHGPARWREARVEVVVDRSVAALGDGAVEAVRAAFAAWDGVEDAYAPLVTVREGTADEVGYRAGEENHCTVRHAPGGFAPAAGALAITVLSYDAEGTIVDADIVLNGAPSRAFAQLPDAHALAITAHPGAYDLQNVLTHEAGHFMGLDEETDPDATMFLSSAPGEIDKRTLSADDESGVRALYPEPLELTSSCAAAPGAPGSARSSLVAALGVAALVASSRARRKR